MIVVLVALAFALDVQAPNVNDILQETQQNLPFLYKNLLNKARLPILNYTT